QSNAANVEIVGNAGGSIDFIEDASAHNATITSASNTRFAGRAVAANADITMGDGATISFSEAANGGTARLHLDEGSRLDIAAAEDRIVLGAVAGAGDVHLGS